MSAITFSNKVFDREVAFCKVYSLESKEKLEKLFLKNRISYFIEWQDRTLWQRLMNKDKSKEKNVFTIRINEADHACFIRFIIFISVHNVLLFRNQTKKKYLPYLPWAAFVALPLPVPRFPAPVDP